MVGSRVFLWTIRDLDVAKAAVAVACAAVKALQEAEFWRFSGRDQLIFAQDIESIDRMVFGTQVGIAGELDSSGVAGQFGAASTAALLRHALAISASEAAFRVNTARVVLPRDGISGGELPPVLPELGAAIAEGGIGVDQTRTIVASMRKLPKDLDPSTRDECEHQLVVHGREFEPAPFANFAKAVVATLTADAAPDDEDRANRIEFHLGVRDPYTGMTKFRGQVDDLGAAVLSQAIDGLSKPCPERQQTGDSGSGRRERSVRLERRVGRERVRRRRPRAGRRPGRG